MTQKLPFTRFWPFLIQASGTAAVPTGPWLSTAYHVRACKHYYGLIRQSDELRPVWLVQPVLDQNCVACHAPGGKDAQAAQLNLTSTNAWKALLTFGGEDLKKQTLDCLQRERTRHLSGGWSSGKLQP